MDELPIVTACKPVERSRSHSSKFKARIAVEARRGEATLAELSQRHGVHASQITAWRKQLFEHAGEVFDNGTPALDDAERQIRDLRAKVGQLTMEGDGSADALGRFGLPSAKR